jgi:predicted kinase
VEAIILIGIQGSGKTTFYREHFFGSHLRLNLDMLRTRHREWALLQTCLRTQQRFVVDNTNVIIAERARYIAPAREARFKVIGYFFEPDPKGAFERNAQRAEAKRVPPAGLFGTLKRLERPTFAEGFDELHVVRIPRAGEFSVEAWRETTGAKVQ